MNRTVFQTLAKLVYWVNTILFILYLLDLLLININVIKEEASIVGFIESPITKQSREVGSLVFFYILFIGIAINLILHKVLKFVEIQNGLMKLMAIFIYMAWFINLILWIIMFLVFGAMSGGSGGYLF